MSAATTRRALGIECELRRRPTAGRDGLGDRGDQAHPHELVDPHGDGRPSESGRLRELRAGARHSVTQQLEQLRLTPDSGGSGIHDPFATFHSLRRPSRPKSAEFRRGCRLRPRGVVAQSAPRWSAAATSHVARPVGLGEALLQQHRDHDDDALRDRLHRRGQVVLHEHVRQRREDQHAEDGAGDRAAPADEQRAADDDRGDRVELVAAGRASRCRPSCVRGS